MKDQQEARNRKQDIPPIQNDDLDGNKVILTPDRKVAIVEENREQKDETIGNY
ncbi:MAG: hypothetical protein ABI325_01315 [Ginsengibacter sp.]